MTKILTGNELLSGATVYLDPQGNWVEDIQAARVFGKDETEALDAAMAGTRATGRILSLETEDVETINGAIRANRIRERIRSEGPTAPRFDRQHLGEDEHVSI